MTDCTIIFTSVQVDEEKRQKFRSRMCRRVKVWLSLLLSLLSIGVEAKLFSFQNRQFILGNPVFRILTCSIGISYFLLIVMVNFV